MNFLLTLYLVHTSKSSPNCPNCVIGKCEGFVCSECEPGFLLLIDKDVTLCIDVISCENSGGNVNLINKTCELCPFCVLGKCLGTVCSECLDNFFMASGNCLTKIYCEQMNGYANPITKTCEKCKNCVQGKCDFMTCSQCLDNYFLYSEFCITSEECKGYNGIPDTINNECVIPGTGCSFCAEGKCIDSHCSECIAGFYYYYDEQIDGCITSEMCENNNGTPNKNSKTCDLCQNCAPGKCNVKHCSECDNGFYLFQTKESGQCIDEETCIYNDGIVDETHKLCEIPYRACSFCEEGKCNDFVCSECRAGFYFFYEDNIQGCITTEMCERISGHPNDDTKTCEVCENCVEGKCNVHSCTECINGLYLIHLENVGSCISSEICESLGGIATTEGKICDTSGIGCPNCETGKCNGYICSKCNEDYYLFQAEAQGICYDESTCISLNGVVNRGKGLCEIEGQGCSFCEEGHCSNFVCSECRNSFYYFEDDNHQGCFTLGKCISWNGTPNNVSNTCDVCENCVDGKCRVFKCTECIDEYYLYQDGNLGFCVTKEDCERKGGTVSNIEKTCTIQTIECDHCEDGKCSGNVCSECLINFYLYEGICLTNEVCKQFGRNPNSNTKTCDKKPTADQCKNCADGKCDGNFVCSQCLPNFYLTNALDHIGCFTKEKCIEFGLEPNEETQKCEFSKSCPNCLENKCINSICSVCQSDFYLVRGKDIGLCYSKIQCESLHGTPKVSKKTCEDIPGIGCTNCAANKCSDYLCSECAADHYYVENDLLKGCITEARCTELGWSVISETKKCEKKSSSSSSGEKEDKPLSSGAIAGIVIGVILAVAIAVGLCVYFLVFKKKGDNPSTNSGGQLETENTQPY